MGLFNIFNKKKSEVEKIEHKVPEHYGTTSELLDEVENLALRYLINDNMLDTYNKEKLDIKYINEARVELEKAIKELNKSLEEYYDNEYSAVGNTKESNKNFPYSLEALVAIFNNSLDLYSDDENTWDTLNLAYNKCNHKLNKVKEDNVKTKGEFEIVTEDLKDEDDGDLIVNNDKLNIYYVRISRNEDESINLNLCVKNKFNKNIIVESKDVSVNGIDTNPKFSISVLAGEKSFDKMVFNTDIAELVNLKCTFVIKDENTNEVLEECSIDIFKED